MTKLLVIDSSPRGGATISRAVTRRFVAEWRATHPDGEVVARNLMETDLTFVTAPWLQAYFTLPEHHTPEMKAALAFSDELVAELLDADEIAIGTPVYNYDVPAILKACIDHIVRKRLRLGDDGSGLVTGKTATVLLASGGIDTVGSPIAARDVATRYLRLVLNVIGIEDVTFVAGGGAKAVDMGKATMADFVGRFDGEIKAAAA